MFGPGAVAAAGTGSAQDENSGVYTPKFQSSNSSTPQCQTPTQGENVGMMDKVNLIQNNKSTDTGRGADTGFSQQSNAGKGTEN